ncbi:diphosphomevalonate/mevalonate 3,5-bisphosphate decarboxylase family protein [Blattabacterium sp. (Cryptocercus punctulatus) str. Cpu]|uniref:diphosphomevalonate/mevalonate 3,5-bisphosphate decarboxylase family protein n=1 Tax=Blattabacterium sp. (Cryptocercus punctulatus) str. Cpu TaxID=1075399 RepID=UPI0002387106|nr:diphosphomevalonate decarboxylase [Blattabacterium sp. (Cryptocercus punctulatus) str. Cpu]AEU09381.1 diphosphomevalonate decarboxylase [Blattabacterium sp. (Cryptocercus punctulatus) str. Cpu]
MKSNCFFYKKKNYSIVSNGVVTKKSYSNIALIKYWGKRKNKIQIPMNSSISYSLEKVYTVTKLIYYLRDRKKKRSIKIFFSGKEKTNFLPKIFEFFHRISFYCSYLRYFNFVIKTDNTFPHSSGIASSASSMSALALCIMEIEKKLDSSLKEAFFLKKASFLARLGSGSACRSIYPGLVVWGKHKSIKGSNNLYSIPYPYKIHPIFKKIWDTILVIDEEPKKILSSKGHQLMNHHPYAKERLKFANRNMDQLISILKIGDFPKFGELIEHESLNLHAMIMTSNPYFLWMRPNTLHVLHKVWDFRKQSKKNIYFTLDAGANVHLLYPIQEKKVIIRWIYSELIYYCKKIIESFCQ